MKKPLDVVAAVALVALGCLSSGCATIVNGPSERVLFSTVPDGAEIVYEAKSYVTPCQIDLRKRSAPIMIQAHKPGYAVAEINCKARFGGWIFGNLFFGGIVGILIDAITSAHYNFDDVNVRVELKAVPPEDAVRIDAEWEAKKKEVKRKFEERRNEDYASSAAWGK